MNELAEKNPALLDSLSLCRNLHAALFGAGIYPALTGGVLYKDGERKDIDIVLYRNRMNSTFETQEIEVELKSAGLYDFKYYGFVTKCRWNGFVVDIFNPETSDGGDYDE